MKGKRILLLTAGGAAALLLACLLLFAGFPRRDTMRWARELTPAQVEKVELVVMPSNEEKRYRLFEQEEIPEVVALVNQSRGRYIASPEPLAGMGIILYITTSDGVRHPVSNVGHQYLVIDGESYEAGYRWLSQWETEYGWNRGSQKVPEDFVY